MKHDELFRQALQRQNDRAAGMQMPHDMEQRVMDRIKPKKTSYRWLYSFSVGAIAATVLLLLMFHFKDKDAELKEKPVTTQQTEQQNILIKDVVKPDIEREPHQTNISYAEREQTRSKVGELPLASARKKPVAVQKIEKKHASAVKNHSAINSKSTPTATAEQLSNYIARLEAEMEAVDDSVRSAHLEKIIAADYRLQQLVNRIVKGDEERALNELQKDSTANYINF